MTHLKQILQYTDNWACILCVYFVSYSFIFYFSGLRCHLDDACLTDPCHGCDTSPVDGRRVCDCPPGKTGINCDVDVNECLESKNLTSYYVPEL